ncbi:MAG: OmpH family outer membrane protein [Myxococcota bacterium]|jgi:outer membrane protein|nr:OmpH family outer membrane protein [Myxococcota bacterium]
MTKNFTWIWMPLAVLAYLMPRIAHAADKIAYVDVQRAVYETVEGKATKTKLEGLQSKLQKKLSDKEKEVMAMQEALQKQKNVLTEPAMQQKVEEYYRAVQELQQTYAQHQKELQDKMSQLTEGLLVKMEKVLAQIGKSDGYTMIYNSVGIAWAPAHLDLTDKAIQLYNETYGKGSAATPAAAPAKKK